MKRAVQWLRANLQRRRYEREMRAEMAEHLERATRRLMSRGCSAEEARREARREFGDVAYHQMKARDARGTLWLDDLKADSRFALRHFARKPGTTIMMLIVLAFGMSISTLLFSLLHGLAVLPPPAVKLDDELVRIRGSRTINSRFDPSQPRLFEEEEFQAYRNLTGNFSAVAGWAERNGVLQLPHDAQRIGHAIELHLVTENYFRVLGVSPILGAGLPTAAADDPAASAVVMIDHQTWRDLFAGRPDVLGTVVTINGRALTIVGVAPEKFNGPSIEVGLMAWVPLAARHLVLDDPDITFEAAARLRPGTTREAAHAAVQIIAARADTISGDQIIREPGAQVVPLLAGNNSPEFEKEIRVMTLMLGALGGLVLLVTCMNVSGLLTGLAAARRREIAVRLSLGAARVRIIRQLLTESAVLAVVAGAAALAIVAIILRVARVIIPDLPLELQIEWPTTGFTFAIALGVGIVFGLSPALHATRLALASVLRDSSGAIASSRARLQRGLVVAQIALTQPLIVLATTMLVLLSSELTPSTESDSAERVVTLRVRTPSSVNWDQAPESQRRQRELMERLRDQVRATPGIVNAVFDWQPYYLGVFSAHSADKLPEKSGATAALTVQLAEDAHFAVLGVPLKSGRTFRPGDLDAALNSPESPVIIGADLAAQLWGSADAVGRRLQPVADPAGSSSPSNRRPALMVIGVVDDPAARTRVDGEPYRVYMPGDAARIPEFMLLRTAAAAAPLLPAIRELAQNAANSAIITAQTLADVEAQQNLERRQVLGAISAGGIAALLLSAIGLYAVIAFSVSQRTQEIAVRLACGANRSRITYSFVREGLRLGALGLVLGLPAGLFAMRQLVATFGMGQLPVTPVILMASTGILLVAAASAWGPARRAAAVHPASALQRG